jgi:transcriptional regulator GlxA family with amidase domain
MGRSSINLHFPLDMLKVQLILFEGCDELDVIAPFEVLQAARGLGSNLQVDLITVDGAEEVTAAHGLRIQPTVSLDLKQPPDIIIVPGGGWIDRTPQGARAEAEHGLIPGAIAQLHQAGTTLASVCTGALLLAVTGLLAGRPATTHHGAPADLQSMGAELVQARVVDDGEVLTAGGVTAGLDLALWLLERSFGPEVSHQVEQLLEYERRGTVWRRSTPPA